MSEVMSTGMGMVIPKSYKQTNEKRFGRSYTWIIVASIFAVISGVLALFIMFSGLFLKLFFITILILMWLFFWKNLRNDDLLEHAKLSFFYFMRLRRGDTEILKYNDASIPILKTFLPVEAIRPNGLIQYAGNLYFLLLKYVPVRLSDDERGVFLQNTIALLNSLQDEITFKFHVVSRNSYNDTFEKQVLEAANDSNSTQTGKDHLYSLQKMVSTKNESNIDWDFYMMFGLGKYDSPAEAEISRQSLLTGLKDLLDVTETDIRVLESHDEITYSLYKCIVQV